MTRRDSRGSGVPPAGWMIDGCIAPSTGTTRPAKRVPVAPRSQVHADGNWRVTGIAGAESTDYSVPEPFLPNGAVAQAGQCGRRLALAAGSAPATT